jgi:hypothetical protein
MKMKRRTSIIYISFFILFIIVTTFVFYQKVFFCSYVVNVLNVKYTSAHHKSIGYQLSFIDQNKKTLKLYTNKTLKKKFSKNKHYNISYVMNSWRIPYNDILKSFHLLN